MAQTNSVQREPSMEEILASIRRIIEDSDGVRPPAEDTAETVAEVRTAGASVIEVEAFRSDLRGKLEPQQKLSGLADIQAEMKHAAANDAALQASSAGVVSVVEPDGSSRGMLDDDLHGSDEDMMAELTLTSLEDDVRSAEAVAPMEQRPAILSERTGRQVAAAFGELSEAFAASRRKSFDEMAEEMLRPMLQDWLDNNLPTMVERLVREEIERVARGVAS